MSDEIDMNVDIEMEPDSECKCSATLPSAPEFELMLKDMSEEELKFVPTSRFRISETVPTSQLVDIHPSITIRRNKFLADKNPFDWDRRIVFAEEPHLYFIDGSCDNVISVTTLIDTFFPHFDAQGQADRIAQSPAFQKSHNQPKYKYFGCKDAQDIQNKWQQAPLLGTALHANIESFLNGEPYSVDFENETCFQQFLRLNSNSRWWNFDSFRTEMSVFDPELRLAGQIDFVGLIRNQANPRHVILIDWKRCENIEDISFSRLTGKGAELCHGVCRHVENCKFNKYSLQLNIYKHLLEKNYQVLVKKMFLVQMHPSFKNGEPVVHVVNDDWSTIVHRMLAVRYATLHPAAPQAPEQIEEK